MPMSGGTLNTIAVDAQKATYGLVAPAVTPAATTTDLLTLSGSATKTVEVRKVIVSGLATTAGGMDVSLVKRTTANLGGTQAAAPAIGQFDSNDPAATATPALYTANPTVGSGVAVLNEILNFGVAGAAGTVVFDLDSELSKAILLHGVAESLAVNLNGQAVPSGGKVSIAVEWQEY